MMTEVTRPNVVSDLKIPALFLCPITHKIMLDPVFLQDGQVYEREAITNWLKNKDTSPLTNERVYDKRVTSCKYVKSQIMEFLTQHNIRSYNEFYSALMSDNPSELDKLRILPSYLDLKLSFHNFHSTLLFEFVLLGKLNSVKFLLDNGVDVNGEAQQKLTALHHACMNDNLDMVKVLVENGADLEAVDARGLTALHKASIFASRDLVSDLLTKGANIDARNIIGARGIHFACGAGNTPIVELFLELGISPNIATDRNETAVHFAVTSKIDTNILQLLLDHGANIEAKDKYGESALHAAVRCDNHSHAKYLLDAGADLQSRSNTGETPLHSAVKYAWMTHEHVKTLLARGANPSVADTVGKTPLHYAKERGDHASVRLIQQHRRAPTVRGLFGALFAWRSR